MTFDLDEPLGSRTLDIIQDIEDDSLRDKVEESLHACTEALEVVDGLELCEHEMADVFETANLATWNALAPKVRDLMKAVRSACDVLLRIFPVREEAPSDFVLDEFDDFSGDHVDLGVSISANPGVDESSLFDSSATRGSKPRAQQIDDLVSLASSRVSEAIAEAVAGLTDILERSFIEFGEKLRNPRIVADRWFLLGELHDFKRNCTECLEAIMASVLHAFSEEPIEELLPRYASATTRALTIRACIVDLDHDLDFYNEAFQQIDADLPQLVSVVEERMNRFAASPAYAILEPSDRKAAILFRLHLARARAGAESWASVRDHLEDYTKYLTMMRTVNRPEILDHHDRSHLEAAQMILDSGVSDAKTAMTSLFLVYGRAEGLDACIRLVRGGHSPPPSVRLAELIQDALVRVS
ncbi:MAG: hypothetical protein IPK13_01580 [Deltaproteobacteria bacterium]|nr:hypothetical protein [Deltaproteobacteria bacterium]